MGDSGQRAAPVALEPARERLPAALDLPIAYRLQLLGVYKRWTRGRIAVLEGVDLVVEPGQVVSIVGANGSGKTTLLRIAAGLISADAGVTLLDGLHPRRDRSAYQRRLGFASAGYGGLYARMSVRAHLDLWARVAFVPPGERRAACEAVLRSFELGELAGRRVDRLSMGQRQRVHLAMAFLHRPRLVLLDEPWNSLDEAGAAVVADALAELRALGGSAVVCMPSGVEPAARIEIDQALRLENGRLVEA